MITSCPSLISRNQFLKNLKRILSLKKTAIVKIIIRLTFISRLIFMNCSHAVLYVNYTVVLLSFQLDRDIDQLVTIMDTTGLGVKHLHGARKSGLFRLNVVKSIRYNNISLFVLVVQPTIQISKHQPITILGHKGISSAPFWLRH